MRTGVTPFFIGQLIIASLLFYILFRVVKKIAKMKGISVEELSEENNE
ncbi:hypothetical protein [endosymbiont 'TC1' of Trimyema compressum]|nr:hypothetical protein [endosymbiont 'TC1' of Trimyema compressum]